MWVAAMEGVTEVYEIERWGWGGSGKKVDRWLTFHPTPADAGEKFSENPDTWAISRPFSACGECWQRTGIKGSFQLIEAIAMLTALAKHSPDKRFRVVKRTYTISTVQLATTDDVARMAAQTTELV